MGNRRLWTVIAIGLVLAGRPASAQVSSPIPDYSKPLFTRQGTLVCSTRDDLKTFLALARNDQTDLLDRVTGCMTFPVDGIPAVILDREGILDVWMRVRLLMPNGAPLTAWTVGSMLRNGDTPAITGDPAAGKARICITKGADGTHVPALAMFKNAGRLIGNLQDKWSIDKFDADTANPHAAIVTTEAATLTKDKPCAEVSARMFVRDDFQVKTWPASPETVWDFDHVLGYQIGRVAQPDNLASLRGQIGLRAVITADLGNPISTSEDDAQKAEPENPANQIPADMARAALVPFRGPDGRGNFRVCMSKAFYDEEGGDDDDGAREKEERPVIAPAGVIFYAFGPLIGDLRSPGQAPNFLDSLDRRMSLVVVTTEGISLSKASPCTTVSVRTIISEYRQWPLVLDSEHLLFQANRLQGGQDPLKLPGAIGDAIRGGALNGTPTADIGHPLNFGSNNP